MSHWTDRIFKSYKQEPGAAPLVHDPESGKRDFELDALIKELAHELPAVRRRAARAIGLLGDRAGVPALIRVLGDPDEGVRSTAAEALHAFALDDSQRNQVKVALARGAR